MGEAHPGALTEVKVEHLKKPDPKTFLTAAAMIVRPRIQDAIPVEDLPDADRSLIQQALRYDPFGPEPDAEAFREVAEKAIKQASLLGQAYGDEKISKELGFSDLASATRAAQALYALALYLEAGVSLLEGEVKEATDLLLQALDTWASSQGVDALWG